MTTKHERRGAGDVAPAVRWSDALKGERCVVLALLTDEGPAAYSLAPLGAIFLADALRDAADAVRRATPLQPPAAETR